LPVIALFFNRARSDVVKKSGRASIDVGDFEVVLEVRAGVVESSRVWARSVDHDDRVQRARRDATAVTKGECRLFCYR
jgi:hypothetical protein